VSKPSICIIAHNAYSALANSGVGHLGGVEVQTSMFAKWLVSHGYKVTFITWQEGRIGDERCDGVDVLKTCPADSGLPGVRFFYPRLTSFFMALARADADVYYHNCAEYYTGAIAMWCRLMGRLFVYSVASEADCRATRPPWQDRREWWLYRYGLRRAHGVIVQTRTQARLVRNDYGISAIHLPMPGSLQPCEPPFRVPRPSGRMPVVVWVGRPDSRKRLEYLFAIARELPHIRFQVVAPVNEDDGYERSLRDEGASIPNLDWLGRVGRSEIAQVYRNADCLCCTSVYEGFPNTFLEAWSQGLPIVSSFDPDGVIETKKLGLTAQSISALVSALQRVTSCPNEWECMSQNALRHYREHHSPSTALSRFEATLLRLWSGCK